MVLQSWLYETGLYLFTFKCSHSLLAFLFYGVLIGLPLSAIIAFFQKGIKSKLLGCFFLIFFIIGLILIGRALV